MSRRLQAISKLICIDDVFASELICSHHRNNVSDKMMRILCNRRINIGRKNSGHKSDDLCDTVIIVAFSIAIQTNKINEYIELI